MSPWPVFPQSRDVALTLWRSDQRSSQQRQRHRAIDSSLFMKGLMMVDDGWCNGECWLSCRIKDTINYCQSRMSWDRTSCICPPSCDTRFLADFRLTFILYYQSEADPLCSSDEISMEQRTKKTKGIRIALALSKPVCCGLAFVTLESAGTSAVIARQSFYIECQHHRTGTRHDVQALDTSNLPDSSHYPRSIDVYRCSCGTK